MDHSVNKKVQNYLNLIYQNCFTPIANKPAKVTRKTSTIIDHVLTDLFVNTNFKTFIFKIVIFLLVFCNVHLNLEKKTKLHILLKESSTITQSNYLNKSYIKPVGMMS